MPVSYTHLDVYKRQKDTLVVDFMNPAPGVTLVDTSELNFEQSVQAVIDIVHATQSAALAAGKS